MTTLWLGVLYLHLLAMAFFLGGQIVLVTAVVPVERSSPDPQRMRATARRFGLGSLVALVVLLGTGAAMAFRFDLWTIPTLQLKLGLVIFVIALALLHLRFPRWYGVQGAILVATLVIVWLGLEITR